MTGPAAATSSAALPAAPAKGAEASRKAQGGHARSFITQLLRAAWGLARRRPVASAAASLLTVAVLIVVVVHAWALHEYQEAGKALVEDRLTEAHNHISSCLAVWPRSADAHFLAARIDRVSDAYTEAEAHLDECRRLQGPTPRTQLEVMLLRAQRGEVDKVGDGLTNAVENGEGDEREILEALARGAMVQTHFVTARALLNRCLEKYPDDVRALDWRGWVLERLEQQDKAANDYEHALALAPGRVPVRMRLALLYLEHNDPGHAEPHLLKLTEVDPNRPEVLLGLARCRFIQGDFDQVGVFVDRVLAVRPDDPTALLYRGKVFLEANPPRLDEAESCFRRVLIATPNDPEAHWGLRTCLSAQPGREAEAAAEAKRFDELIAIGRRIADLVTAEVDRVPTNPAPAYELGKLNLDLGNDDQAKHWIIIALQRDPNHKPARALLADYYEKKGDKEAAARERALANK